MEARESTERAGSASSTPTSSKKKKRSRIVDRNSPRLQVKSPPEDDTGLDGDAGGQDDDEESKLAKMLEREKQRQVEKRRRSARRKRDAEIKKKQISRSQLKKAMLHRHWSKLEEAIHKAPPPKAQSFNNVVPQPIDLEVNAEFTHPATTSYHTMKHLPRDDTKISPIFFDYPIDLASARVPLVPDWKRALERKRPLPLHPSLRSPCMAGYSMHASSGWDQALFNPIFYTYKTATGDHLDAEGIKELVKERESLYPHRPRFMWQLRDKFKPCFLCGKPEGEVRSCPRCGRRGLGSQDAKGQFNFVEAREVAAASATLGAKEKGKEQLAIAKKLARTAYVKVIIKPMPMGRAVYLNLDNRSTMQYLYFLYRSNAGGDLAVHRNVHLFLPTYKGVFYLDRSIVPETPTSVGSDSGYNTLADYNVLKVSL